MQCWIREFFAVTSSELARESAAQVSTPISRAHKPAYLRDAHTVSLVSKPVWSFLAKKLAHFPVDNNHRTLAFFYF